MNRLITAIFTSVIFASANAALAQPFRFYPESFASYLNQKNWDDGKRRTFSNLRGCEYAGIDRAYCQYAYVTIDDPVRGRIFCELMTDNSWVVEGKAVWWYRKGWLYGGTDGRWDGREYWGHGKLKVCKSI
jgi:hypothetical protein